MRINARSIPSRRPLGNARLGSGDTLAFQAGEHCATGIMDRYRAKTSTFFSGLANALGVTRRPLSKSLGPPGPQTCRSMCPRINSTDQPSISSHLISAVFEFPDELILSVLSYVSPALELTGQYARFRFQYNMDNSDYHRRRMEFLLSLSMTCRTMRLRLLPWIWKHIEASSWKDLGRRHKAIVDVLRTDPCLGMSVRYFRPFIRRWVGVDLCPLKVPDHGSHVQVRSPFVRQMSSVTSESPHTRGIMGKRAHYRPARESPQAHRTPSDSDSGHTTCCSPSSPTLSRY